MSNSSRIRVASVATIALLVAAGPAGVQARTTARPAALAYGVGTYSGKITQVVPKPYAGTMSVVVTAGQITGLRVVVGVTCHGLGWVRDRDPIPTLTVDIGPTGAFSYVGTLAGRHLRLSGIFTGHRLVGWFLETFWLGHDFCTMGRPALYTGTV